MANKIPLIMLCRFIKTSAFGQVRGIFKDVARRTIRTASDTGVSWLEMNSSHYCSSK